eukprot:Blabericola_migrator_1__8134@NODE_419_length_8686_cov_23_589744_g331_i0_p2_GENE_NODE_419_length_8686_cov_23_589744_g331_i0NODE_419_length_8686_cov_23_589744_g331_i0_p2_ORF_typecomplete_len535_score88_39_NODE_419_length_8686_cov_23_589744_g331_i02021806
MSRHLIKKPKPLSLECFRDLAVLLSVACPFTEQDLHHILTHFSSPPDTKIEYTIAVREYLRAALLSHVNLEEMRSIKRTSDLDGIRLIEGATPDIKIEQWKNSMMYNVKRASSTELSLEDSWQSFVQSLSEHLGFETDKCFVEKQSRGRPYEVYARKKSPSTLELGVSSSHKVKTFKKFLEKKPSKFSLDNAKAISAAFWTHAFRLDFDRKGFKPTKVRNDALWSIAGACAFGEDIGFHNDEWESTRPPKRAPSPDWFEEQRLAKKELAEAYESEVSMLTDTQRENRIMSLSNEVSDIGRRIGVKRLEYGGYAQPLKEYCNNLKCWQEPLVKLLTCEEAQYAHCWQIALDFVRQQTALYYQWNKDWSPGDTWISAQALLFWCRNSSAAKTQMQKFQKRLKAVTEGSPSVRTSTYPNFQCLTESILKWSQYCLDYAEKKKDEIREKIDRAVETGDLDVLSTLREFSDYTSRLESEWDWEEWRPAKRAAWAAQLALDEYKAAMKFKGKKLDKFWLDCEQELKELESNLYGLKLDQE